MQTTASTSTTIPTRGTGIHGTMAAGDGQGRGTTAHGTGETDGSTTHGTGDGAGLHITTILGTGADGMTRGTGALIITGAGTDILSTITTDRCMSPTTSSPHGRDLPPSGGPTVLDSRGRRA